MNRAAPTPDLRDIKEIEFIDWFDATPYIWLAIIVASLIATFLVFRWLSRRKKAEPIVPPAPPRPAHEVALERLHILQGADLLEQEEGKRYHYELSEILRQYVELRFLMPASDMTTEQIQQLIDAKTSLSKEQSDQVVLILKSCDRVKFADEKLAIDSSKKLLQDAIEVVQETAKLKAPADEVLHAAG